MDIHYSKSKTDYLNRLGDKIKDSGPSMTKREYLIHLADKVIRNDSNKKEEKK